MNYAGSYRKLLGNSKAAIMAAIEIYNKPIFEYRDECVVILLLNGWELVLKAMLSKNREHIFYPKKRNQPYRTLSCDDALAKAQKYFPAVIPYSPVKANIELLAAYRDNAVHFYNERDFGVILYSLAQTSIQNFRDVVADVFGDKLEEEMNWQLLPLGIRAPVDVITYMSRSSTKKASSAVRQYLAELSRASDEVKRAGGDTGRLMTVFPVKLESVKKIGDADVVVGVKKADETGPLAIVRNQDPNITHPLRQREIVDQVKTLHGQMFNTYTFQAIAWKRQLKSDSQYCWQAKEGFLTKYSNEVVALIKSMTRADLEAAMKDYREHRTGLTKRKKRAA